MALVLAGCGGGSNENPRLAARSEVRLPKGAYPRFLAFSRDGALWVTEAHAGAVARVDRSGTVKQIRLPERESTPGDIEEGPDGAMWLTGVSLIAKVDPAEGATAVVDYARDPRIGVPLAITAGPGGTMWATTATTPPRVMRLAPDGRFRSISVPARGFEIILHGIVEGPDRALWLTESADEPWEAADAIVRITPSGRIRRWRLPDRRSGPARIAVGADGALWFTEERASRIGRITLDGQIEEFPLRPGLVPFEIAPAPDGTLYFSTRHGVGRVTAAGRTRVWGLAGARRLAGLAVAADGSVWVADSDADTIRHFQPPA